MADFIGWMTDVLAVEFTVGAVTITLGALAISAVVVFLGIKLVQRLLGGR